MSYSLSTIRRGLRNLFTKRLGALEASKAGAYYKDDLQSVHQAIADLPDSLTSIPFKVELRQTDERHDRFGKVIFLVTEVCFTCPEVDPAFILAATEIRRAFIPSLDALMEPYATEAEKALARKPLLQSMKAQLEMFKLPWDSAQTLHDVATAFIAEGERLDELLHQRADVPKAVRTRAGALRSKALGVLNRLRRDLREEVQENQQLPRDLEQQVFGFFDTLHSLEAAGRSSEAGDEDGEADAAVVSISGAGSSGQPG